MFWGSSLDCIIFIVLTNSYEHPHEETLQRLEEVGTEIFRTDESGVFEVRFESEKIVVSECIKTSAWRK